MAKPIQTSRSNHIGNHEVVDDLGPISVAHPSYRRKSFGFSFIDAFTFGAFNPDFWESEIQAFEALKESARKVGADGVINISVQLDSLHGIYLVEGVAVTLRAHR